MDPQTATVTSPREIVEAYVREHDASLLAADAVFTDMSTGMTWTGRKAIGGMLEWMYHGVFDAHVEDARLIVGDDGADVVLEATFVGVHRGEFAGVPATGRTVRVPLVVLYGLMAGEIVNARIHFNAASFRAQTSA
jgi:steroid delta-isomerase-like uncharacterized protein